MASNPKPVDDAAGQADQIDVSPVSKELVVGMVSYAGAGCSIAGRRIRVLLQAAGYEVILIKISDLIVRLTDEEIPALEEGAKAGKSKFARASRLQDIGDRLRDTHGGYALAVAAIREIKSLRGETVPGTKKTAFILDSLKHPEEVRLLRQVYDLSFRMVAVHCDRSKREIRLIGSETSIAKYAGVSRAQVIEFMKRDEKDNIHDHGQRVLDVFHLADFFLDNTEDSQEGAAMSVDIDRFIDLLLDKGLVRPRAGERAIYHAYAAALQSSCLSRQVGAALIAEDGSLIATGTNDPPKFKGGIYDEASDPDHRCFKWKFTDGNIEFVGCHNDRKKEELNTRIADWLAVTLPEPLALALVPKNLMMGSDLGQAERAAMSEKLAAALKGTGPLLKNMPGIKDLLEFSRSIHAEMAALMSAMRAGVSAVGASLYVTTYPCHSCARHLVAAGVAHVYFIEPYVKSLAVELHSDAIASELPPLPKDGTASDKSPDRMSVVPFTGVGPRMYEDFFTKRGELKAPGGRFDPSQGGVPFYAVRLRELEGVESAAAELIPEMAHV